MMPGGIVGTRKTGGVGGGGISTPMVHVQIHQDDGDNRFSNNSSINLLASGFTKIS